MYRKIYQFLQKRNVGTRFQICIYTYTHTHNRIQSEGGILKAVLRQSRWHIDSSVVPSRFGTTHGWRKNTDARGERFLFREQNPASAKMFTMNFDPRATSRGRKKKFHLATFNIYKKLKRMKVSLVETTTVRVNSISGWILNIRPGNHISMYT